MKQLDINDLNAISGGESPANEHGGWTSEPIVWPPLEPVYPPRDVIDPVPLLPVQAY